MDPKIHVCDDLIKATNLDFLCQVKRHTIENFGQRNLHNNLLSHNGGALRRAITEAVKAARDGWTDGSGNRVPWEGDEALLEKAWLHWGPKWMRRELAIPRPGSHVCVSPAFLF